MKTLHLTEKDYRTSAWSGGTTTEIFIWPENGSYARREFAFRISSARVDLPESDFTALPGVERYITPLTGGFTLTHGVGAPMVLGPLAEPYRFDGGIDTHCVGQATDFNLMLKGVAGEMTLCRGTATIRPGFNGLYALEEGLFGNVRLEKGDFLAVFAQESEQIPVTASILCWVDI